MYYIALSLSYSVSHKTQNLCLFSAILSLALRGPFFPFDLTLLNQWNKEVIHWPLLFLLNIHAQYFLQQTMQDELLILSKRIKRYAWMKNAFSTPLPIKLQLHTHSKYCNLFCSVWCDVKNYHVQSAYFV